MNNFCDFAWNVEHRKQAGARPFRMPALLGALLCAAGLLAIPGKAFSQVPRGVFAIANNMAPVPAVALMNPDVDGISLRQTWATIEPMEGVFDFSYLDSTIAICASHGKQVLLRVSTMSGRPAWVDTAVRNNGGRFFKFTDEGVPTKIPMFWDPTFLAKKKALIAALGARFTNNPTVTIVVVSFANATSEDWNVPHTPEYVPQWLRLGYTSAKMVDAGAQLIGATLDAFPNQFVTLAEGGNGNTLDPDETYVARTAIANARALYPGRLIVQRNALSTCIVLPPAEESPVWNLLWISQPDVAGQMLFQCFDEPTYRVNCGVRIDPALALMAAVDRGILYGMNYIEIYMTDVRNLPTAITYAHNLLHPR
jgi:Beta-galactosidase